MHRFGIVVLTAIAVVSAGSASGAAPPDRARSLSLQPSVSFTLPSPAAPPAPTRGAAPIQRFQAAAARPFDVTVDPRTGVVRSLFGGRTQPYGADPSAAARAFLRGAAPLLGPAADPAAMTVAESRTTTLGNHVEFQQNIRGIPVLGRRVVLNLSASGEVLTVENTTGAVAPVDTSPTISALQAARIAGNGLIGTPTLAIDANRLDPLLVWEFTYRDGPGKTLRATVDAHTGKTLSLHNTVMTITGSGTVYKGNPVSVSPTTEPFPYLTGDGTLTGTYTKVYKYVGWNTTTDQPAGVQDVDEPSNIFDYPTSDLRSGEAEAYWGITAIHGYFKDTFGFRGREVMTPAYTQIQGYANADYNPAIGTDGGMEFGVYNGYDYALDADVLFHEFTHSVIDKAAPSFAAQYDNETHVEQGGMNEGIADYYSSSFLNDPVLGEYVAPIYGVTFLRSLTNRNHFPEDVQTKFRLTDTISYQDFPEVHRIGEIWGPACWDLRRALGQEKADQLIFDSLSLLGSNSRMQSEAGNLLAADQARYLGANAATIRAVFARRGIATAAYPIPYLSSDAFEDAASGLRTGYVKTDGDHDFPAYDPAYFSPYGLFPSMVAGRYYAIFGYLTDPTIKSVFVGFAPDNGELVYLNGGDIRTLPTKTSETETGTYGLVSNLYGFAPAVIPAGQQAVSGLLYIYFYTEDSDTVLANINTIAPADVVGGAEAQVILDQTPPILLGDVDGNGRADLADAVLALRGFRGLQSLTGDQQTRGDIAPPYQGVPDVLDVVYILKTSAGLE